MADINKSILLVDDDLTLREMYAERLKAEGFAVDTAKDGEEALQKVTQTQPNIVLLDVMMPKINGLDVLKKMREQEGTKNIPVIVLTALIQDREKMESITRGADDYIVKSETMPGDVIQKVKNVLEKRAAGVAPGVTPPTAAVPTAPAKE